MKKQSILLFALMIFSFVGFAQKSPPAKATGNADGVSVTVDYHQPSARGRKIMGGLVPFGEVWRTGANAVTSIEFSANAKVEGQAVPKGKYGLYTIPGETEWTVILSKEASGSPFDYSEKKDLLRAKVKSAKTASLVETFTISVEGNNVVLKRENTSVSFKISKG
ncbi:MAG: DUF2911 domain-containing protein [Flammeovirgaceae bacterium]